jgi:hypothetical protein
MHRVRKKRAAEISPKSAFLTPTAMGERAAFQDASALVVARSYCAALSPASLRMREKRGLDSPRDVHYQAYQEEDQEDKEQDLRDTRRRYCDATEAENRGDQGNYEKDQCIAQHGNRLSPPNLHVGGQWHGVTKNPAASKIHVAVPNFTGVGRDVISTLERSVRYGQQ